MNRRVSIGTGSQQGHENGSVGQKIAISMAVLSSTYEKKELMVRIAKESRHVRVVSLHLLCILTPYSNSNLNIRAKLIPTSYL